MLRQGRPAVNWFFPCQCDQWVNYWFQPHSLIRRWTWQWIKTEMMKMAMKYVFFRASDISRKKKPNFAGFSGANSRKNRPISWDFRGENKSKFPKKSADFAGVYQQKAKFRRIFRGKFAEKSADFTGNFGGKLRQETINKKQPISLDFFWQISLKSINFASIWPALFNVFLTGIIICSLN